ncbi:hypothetical protein ACG93R_07945 [Acinetobacter guillouiae]|uniref:LEM-3-like GIY-YIG domain-containing protein n=1 Tax=Acinetobacter guillouiae TaxID=106649 RepID=UPI003AF4EFAC
MTIEKFSSEIIEQLKWYVYRLIDPRDGLTFYVGRGRGNRVFDHINGLIEEQYDEFLSLKMKQIRDIKLANLDIIHVIHRHGLESQDIAAQIEAALIDAYPGLTNIVNGEGSNEYGVAHVQEIINMYKTETVDITHKALIISVNKSSAERDVYDAVRFAWRLNRTEAEKAEIILATVQGIIKGAFIAEKWLEATDENFPNFKLIDENSDDKSKRNNRYGFIGKEASPELQQYYLGKRIPEIYRKKGASNPVKYSWKTKN